jgi:2-amino-4-hydroxy-6-hydroxymethyldihydropteridine diphosphokinase
MADVLIGLGGNIGDVAATFELALARLEAAGCRLLARSSNWKTPPWGFTDQPAFVNACARLETTLAPQAFLALCLKTETELGRRREIHWGPRVIDIDVLDYDGQTIAEPDLVLPHPFVAERAFVLVPLAEIAPERLIAGRTVAALRAAIDTTGITPA